jgi:hypothetical protein
MRKGDASGLAAALGGGANCLDNCESTSYWLESSLKHFLGASSGPASVTREGAREGAREGTREGGNDDGDALLRVVDVDG